MTKAVIQGETELQLTHQLESTTFSSFDQVLPRLKDIHSNYQTDIVSDLNKISIQTQKIVSSLSGIQRQIAEYQGDIDEWANKINNLTTQSQVITAGFEGFQRKINNCEKLGRELKSRLKR